jgi:protocatechuate 3,4-dioxygenase beta subunit
MDIARRGLIAAAGGLVAAAATGALADPRRPTPRNEVGPFYRRGAPHEARLVRPGDAGQPLLIAGTVYRATGEVVPHARVELWHADDAGQYDVDGDHFRADLTLSEKAAYSVSTVMPGHYPDRVCQHVHFLVRAEGCKPLVTQLYFATDPVFEGDPDRNFTRDPLIGSRELVRPVTLVSAGGVTTAHTGFDLVMEAA